MSDSNWRPVAAAGIILALLFGVPVAERFTSYQAGHTQDRIEASEQDAGDSRERGEAACTSITGGGFTCTIDILQTQPSDSYAKHDLRAQQEMAQWALGVLLVSIGGFLLTGIGVWLLWLTLEATNATLAEAEATTKAALAAAGEAANQTAAANRSADAAVEQNRLARQQLLEASRPELFGSVEKADLDEYIAGKNTMSIITIRLDNFGERTAIFEEAHADLVVAEKPPVPDAELPIMLSGRTAIAPQGHNSELLIGGKLLDDDLETGRKQHARFFVCGYVPYHDRMGGAWEVGFCFEYWFLQLDKAQGDLTVTHQNWSAAGGSRCNFDRPREQKGKP